MTQLVKGKRFHSIACKFITGEPFSPCGYRTGILNLRQTCPKWQAERFGWHMTVTAVPFFFISFAHPAYLYCEEYVYTVYTAYTQI
jgi:hypothetical protein